MSRPARLSRPTALAVLTMTAWCCAPDGVWAQAAEPMIRRNATEAVTDHVHVILDQYVSMVPERMAIVDQQRPQQPGVSLEGHHKK